MAPIYESSNTILAIIYKKPKYYFDNYLQKPNIILATTYKSLILFWQLFTKAQYYFDIFYQKTQNYKANNYSIKAQIPFGKNNYIILKA